MLDRIIKWFRRVPCINCGAGERESLVIEYDNFPLCRKCAQRIIERDRREVTLLKDALEPFAAYGRVMRETSHERWREVVWERGDGFVILRGDFIRANHSLYGKPIGSVTNMQGIPITDKNPVCPECRIVMTGYDPEISQSGWFCERCQAEDMGLDGVCENGNLEE